MAKKSQADVIKELQESPEYVILNNPLFAPKLIRKLGRKQEVIVSEAYPMKLFIEIIARMKPELLEQEGQIVSLPMGIKEFLDSIEASGSKNLYAHVIDCVDSLTSTKVNWSDTQFDYGTNVVSAYKHDRGSGKIELLIYKEFAKKILEVTPTEHFSFLKKHLFRLKNSQSIRLFLFLSRWKNRGRVEIQLDAFKKSFGCDTAGYERFNKVKMRILEPALNEINEKTEMYVTYEVTGDNLESKKPRVTGLRFFIQEKPKQKQLKAENTEGGLFDQLEVKTSIKQTIEPIVIEDAEIVNIESIEVNAQENLIVELSPIVVTKFGVSLKVFMALVEHHTDGEIRKAIQVTEKVVLSRKVGNIAGFFVEALRGKYQDNEEQKRQLEQQKATEQKAKLEAAKQVARTQEQAKDEYSRRESDRKNTIIKRLIEEDSNLLYEALTQFKNGSLGRNYDESKTVEENLKVSMVSGVLMAILEKLEPNIFQ